MLGCSLVEVFSLTTDQIEDTLSRVFQDVFDEDDIVIRPDLSAKDIPAWDSLTHIRLLLTVEREFHIKFSMTEVSDLKNVGELMELIQAKTAAFSSKK
jgi:acyl carrier protein